MAEISRLGESETRQMMIAVEEESWLWLVEALIMREMEDRIEDP